MPDGLGGGWYWSRKYGWVRPGGDKRLYPHIKYSSMRDQLAKAMRTRPHADIRFVGKSWKPHRIGVGPAHRYMTRRRMWMVNLEAARERRQRRRERLAALKCSKDAENSKDKVNDGNTDTAQGDSGASASPE